MVVLVLTLSGSVSSAGSAVPQSMPATFATSETETGAGRLPPSPRSCHHLRQAVRFYRGRIDDHRSRLGVGSYQKPAALNTCPQYLARLLRLKAYAWRERVEKWLEYHYDWRHWLPAKWYRIGVCETQLNWRHSNSSYEGAFGFAVSTWDSFKSRADRRAGPYPEDAWQATPRQQYEVALAVWREFGFSGWGCRGA